MTTLSDLILQSFNDIIRTNLIPQQVAALAAQGIRVTEDQLAEPLDLPLKGDLSLQVQSDKPKAKRTKKEVEQFETYIKGVNCARQIRTVGGKTRFCGNKPEVEGNDYCNKCLSMKVVKDMLKTQMKPGDKVKPGVAPKKAKKGEKGPASTPEVETEPTELDSYRPIRKIIQFSGDNELETDVVTCFVFKREDDGRNTVYGKTNQENKQIFELSEEDKKLAVEEGFTLYEASDDADPDVEEIEPPVDGDEDVNGDEDENIEEEVEVPIKPIPGNPLRNRNPSPLMASSTVNQMVNQTTGQTEGPGPVKRSPGKGKDVEPTGSGKVSQATGPKPARRVPRP